MHNYNYTYRQTPLTQPPKRRRYSNISIIHMQIMHYPLSMENSSNAINPPKATKISETMGGPVRGVCLYI